MHGRYSSDIAGRAAGEDVAFSVVTLIELAHGAARADTAERKTMRQQFLQELTTALPVHPVTVPVALRAGQIDGESTAMGVRIAGRSRQLRRSATSDRRLAQARGVRWAEPCQSEFVQR